MLLQAVLSERRRFSGCGGRERCFFYSFNCNNFAIIIYISEML